MSPWNYLQQMEFDKRGCWECGLHLCQINPKSKAQRGWGGGGLKKRQIVMMMVIVLVMRRMMAEEGGNARIRGALFSGALVIFLGVFNLISFQLIKHYWRKKTPQIYIYIKNKRNHQWLNPLYLKLNLGYHSDGKKSRTVQLCCLKTRGVEGWILGVPNSHLKENKWWTSW